MTVGVPAPEVDNEWRLELFPNKGLTIWATKDEGLQLWDATALTQSFQSLEGWSVS